MLTARENYLRNARFQTPDRIPINVYISKAMWTRYGGELHRILKRHPNLFPNIPDSSTFVPYDEESFFDTSRSQRDAWGCLWGYPVEGLDGIVIESPLEDWDRFSTYRFPDPEYENDRSPRDWASEYNDICRSKAEGLLTSGGLQHGFLLLRLTYLRGFENACIDLMNDSPEMAALIEGIECHSRYILEKYLSMDVDVLELPEDLGTQQALLISPKLFRKWILPVYKRLMAPCRSRGKEVAFHSDGYIMEIIQDLIEAGVTIVNPQDLVNGIDNLAREVKGRACIRLDVDRQKIIPFGTGKEIEELIEEEVRKLGSREGGLEFIVGLYPPTPPENVEALCAAFEKYQRWWWQ